ncbi:MAG TPA: YciI family protein [Mycobacterium sp.]|nr:YciI family protein [Mycobacterium sp.]
MFHVLTSSYLQPLDVIEQTRPAHIAWLKDEVQAGRIVLAGRQESQNGAVLITGDISVEQAEKLIAADPYQRAGLVRYERLGFNGAFRAPGL